MNVLFYAPLPSVIAIYLLSYQLTVSFEPLLLDELCGSVRRHHALREDRMVCGRTGPQGHIHHSLNIQVNDHHSSLTY